MFGKSVIGITASWHFQLIGTDLNLKSGCFFCSHRIADTRPEKCYYLVPKMLEARSRTSDYYAPDSLRTPL
jgi:hypothetical protein